MSPLSAILSQVTLRVSRQIYFSTKWDERVLLVHCEKHKNQTRKQMNNPDQGSQQNQGGQQDQKPGQQQEQKPGQGGQQQGDNKPGQQQQK